MVSIVGVTASDPLRSTAPMALSMDAELASFVVQARVDEPPGGIISGVALNVMVGKAASTVTFTGTEADPPAPVAVIVYVVVVIGETLTEPFTGTAPTPLSIEAVIALAVVQVRVEDPPFTMVAGDAEMIAVGGGLVTVTSAVAVAVSTVLETVMV
jgi:hypothetical protein